MTMTGAQASIGRLIGNYRVESELAHNGVSCVYRGARNAPPEGLVAIKVWHALPLSPLKQLQFLQDVRLLQMLRHPHMLPILEGGIDGDCPYLVTDYAPAGSLRDRLEAEPARPLPLPEGLAILSQVGQALQYAHHFHIAHGNLKPENILFTAHGEALLADFAISTVLEAARSAPEEAAPTASYLAPEQVHGVTNEASDQYALGCIGYELLTGRLPFPAVDERAGAQERPLPPTLLNMLLPAPLEKALLTALAREQEARYASVKDFLTAVGSASLYQQRQIPVPVTPRLTLPAPPFPWFLAQPTSSIAPASPGTKHHDDSSVVPDGGEFQQRSDRAETPKLLEKTDTAIFSPTREAPLPQDRTPERVSPRADARPTEPFGARALPHAAGRETRRPVSGRSSAGARHGSRNWGVLWLAALILLILVVAGISSFSRFATFSLFSPQAAVQISPTAPVQTSPAEPAAGPAAAPSPIPSATPLPSAIPTSQPSPSPSPSPTPSPTPTVGLTATPSQINAPTDCRVRGHWYTCMVSLALPPDAGGGASWSASSSGFPQASFSPSAGMLFPGQQQQVSVSVRSSCPATASLIFSSGSRTTTVAWIC